MPNTQEHAQTEIRIPMAGVHLGGELNVPPGAVGVVLFAHGSGSSRHSPRNQFVARTLREHRVGTLLFDLLTETEEAQERFSAHLRFDIGLLACRLLGVTYWYHEQQPAMALGYFGSSTGAAAALVAEADSKVPLRAIVSRGGRPDLAGAALPRVKAPTLLIVGDRDTQVVELNRQAAAQLRGPQELRLIPGATHLFEERGALEQVAQMAAEWFARHFQSHD
jgi:predicted alpha/beta-hydrolase family hydrolase